MCKSVEQLLGAIDSGSLNDDGLRPIDLTKNKQVRALLEK
jgi:hypothetical protein